jgi:hypothetical protein
LGDCAGNSVNLPRELVSIRVHARPERLPDGKQGLRIRTMRPAAFVPHNRLPYRMKNVLPVCVFTRIACRLQCLQLRPILKSFRSA